MKQIFTCVFSIFMLTVTAQITIPNAGFESWDSGTYYNPHVPTGWLAGGFFPDVTKVTDAHSGSFAMKISVGQYFTGVGCGGVNAGFRTPISSTSPLYYRYWAKIHLRRNDKFVTGADLSKTGSTTGISYIDYNSSFLDTTQNSNVWRQISFPLLTSFPGPYDTVALNFYISNAQDTSSYVIVDDLAFSSYPAGIGTIADENIIEGVYPNPAINLGTIIYTITERTEVSLDIYDLLGRKLSSVVHERQDSGRYKAEVALDTYPDGVYLVNLTAMGKPHIQKLIIRH